MDWILWIIPPFPIKHQKDDDDDDSHVVWSNVRVGGNMFKRHLNLPGNTQRLAVILFIFFFKNIYIYIINLLEILFV